jgi:hypothetical protein
MKQFMWAYINLKLGYTGQWQASSLKIADHKDLPVNLYGAWNEAVINKHPKIAQEIHAHLQSIGKFVKAMDLVNFMDTPEMRE